MKRFVSSLLAIVIILGIIPFGVDAAETVYNGTCGDNLSWTLDDEGILTISGNGNMLDYSSYTNVPWYAIRNNINSVVVEDGVTSIGKYAFYGFSNLKNVTIGSDISTIGNYSFYNCEYIEKIYWNAKSVEDFSLDNYIFYKTGQKSSGIEFVFSDNVVFIPANLSNPSIHTDLSPKIINLIFGKNVTTIGRYAFYGCNEINNIIIPNSVKNIGDSAFQYCSGISDIYYIGNQNDWNLISVDSNNTSITNSYIHFIIEQGTSGEDFIWLFDDEGTLIIRGNGKLSSNDEYSCFSSRKDEIYSLVLDSGITGVTGLYFSLLSNMESLYLPDTFSFFDREYTMENTIGNCKSLCEIFVDENNNELCSIDGVLYNKDLTKLLRVPRCKNVIYDIPVSVVEIGDKASYNCNNLDIVYYAGSREDWNNISIASSNECLTNAAIYYSKSDNSINVSDIENLQSAHPYLNSMDTTWVYTHPSDADSLSITFSDDTETESNYDFIYIYDKFDNLISQYSGTELAGQTININGNVVKIKLTSDGSVTKNGFTVTSIDAALSTGPITNLKMTSRTKNSVTLSFNEPKDSTSVTVEQSVNGKEWVTSTTAEALNTNSTVATVTGLETETQYYFRVNVVDGIRKGLSNEICVSTLNNYTDIENFVIDNDTIVQYIGEIDEVIIPEEVNGVPIIKINASAFEECLSIKSVTIPDSIVEIGYNAFAFCENLETVHIGTGLTDVDGNCFCYCDSLSGIYVDGNNPFLMSENGTLYNKDKTVLIKYPTSNQNKSFQIPSTVTQISSFAFANCSSLEEVFIPSSVTHIEDVAFCYCTNLDNIQLPNSVEHIGSYAFEETAYYNDKSNWDNSTLYIGDFLIKSHATGEYTIKDGTIIISGSSFEDCTGLTSIVVPDSVRVIGDRAFSECNNLKEITIGEKVDTIGYSPFENCKSLEKIYWNAIDVKGDEPNQPLNCQGLFSYNTNGVGIDGNGIEIIFGNSVEKIPEYLFEDSEVLKSVTIGKNVKSIGYGAFDLCENLQVINWNAISAVNLSADGATSPFYSDTKYQGIELNFGDNVQEIPDYAFSGCWLKGFELPSSVVKIGTAAFEYVEGTISISDNVLDVSNNAFYRCNLNINNVKLTNIGETAFSGCEGSMSVTVGDCVESIPYAAFESCNALTNIEIPDTLINIDEDAFKYCENLEILTIGTGVSQIGFNAFSNCYNLKKIYWNAKNVDDFSEMYGAFYNAGKNGEGVDVIFSNDVETIPACAFYSSSEAPNLKTLTIGNNVNAIGHSAFKGCSNINKIWWNPKKIGEKGYDIFEGVGQSIDGFQVVFSDNVEYIPNVFESSNISEMSIGKNVTTINPWAFYGCEKLTNLTIPDSVLTIGLSAFEDCSNIRTLSIGKNVSKIGEDSFADCSNLEKIYWNAINVDDYCSGAFHGAGQSGEGIDIIFGNEVESIPAHAFGRYYSAEPETPKLKEVTIGNSVRNIGKSAFQNCEDLSDVIIPNSVINIGDYAFYGCKNLNSITIPDSVTNIGDYAFCYCSSLSNLVVGNGIENISEATFAGCDSLTSITLPFIGSSRTASRTYDSVFGYIFGYTNDKYTEGTTYQGYFNKVAMDIPYYYYIPNNITDVVITDALSIPYHAFYNCSNVKSITIPNTVTEIYSYAFSGCSNLTSITIPDSVKSIAYYAFEYCTSLTDVYYTGSEADWANIEMGNGNGCLTNATIHYAYGPGADDEPIVNEERYKEMTFHVEGYPEDEIVFEGEPVENATVAFRGATKKTDKNGYVVFYKDELTEETGGEVVTADGYWGYDSSDFWIMPFDGVCNVSLTKKNPEKIYITKLYATSSTGEKYDLKIRNDFSVDKTDATAYKFKVNVDWNEHEAGKVYLKGDKSGKSFEFVNGEVSISPGAEFEVGENVRVIAQTADGTKTATEENLINVVALPEEFSLVIPQVIDDTMSSVDFMVGKSFQLGVDSGIEKLAGKVDVVDGKLVIEFSGGVGEGSSSKKKGRFEIFDGKYIEVEPHGKIELPLAIANSEWSGTFGVDGKADPIVEYDWNKWVLIPNVGYIPVTATVKFSGGVSSELELSGGMDKVSFDGKITPSLTLDAFGGLGVDYDTVEMKAGVYLNAKGELEIVCHALDPESEFNPSLAGEVGVRAKIKVWIVNVEGEAEAGKFKWNKEGFKATWFGDDVSLLALENDSWQLSGREYLENGGGFIGGNNIALFDLEVTNKDEQIIYNNIFDNAEAVLQNIDDRTVLVYTIDDTEREEQNGLKLVYSEKLSDGTWSEPIAIDDDGTLDSIISADEKFVVWEDMKSELSDPSMQIKDILAKTEISAAYYDGENWISAQLTSNDIYDFSPTIKTNGNMAIAAWLSNTESDFTSQSGTTNIHYATFDGTSWSEITTIENVGTVTRITAAYDGDTPYIFYKKDGIIYSVSAMDGTETTLSYSGVGQYAVDTFNDKIVLAYFDANGNLKVSDDAVNSSAASTVTTEAAVNSIPVIAVNDTDMYVGWIDHQDGYDTLCGVRYENGIWSDKITFVGEEANVSNPSLVANDDGTFSASYFKTGKVEISESGEYTTGEVNLFVNNISPSYNLAIDNETLSYDDEIYTRGNVAAITFDVKNVGEKNVSGFDVEIYENDELKKIISKTTEIKAGATVSANVSYDPIESGKIQKLQIKVVPTDVDDFDESDNVATISVGTVDATITNAYFTEEGQLNYINAIIKNNGSAIADSIIVSVHRGSKDGDVIYQTEIKDVLSHEELLVKAEIAENNLAETSLFYVTVETQNDVNVYNNNSIAVKKNEGDLTKASVMYDTEAKIVTIHSNQVYPNSQIFIAAYCNEKPISLKSQTKDIVSGDNTVTFSDFDSTGADTIKVFVWESATNLKPLFNACVVEVNENVEEKSIAFDKATNTAIIKSEKEYKGAVVFFATYNKGKLIFLKSVNNDLIIGENTANPEEFSLDNADTVKVMVLESTSNIKPLFEVCVVELK